MTRLIRTGRAREELFRQLPVPVDELRDAARGVRRGRDDRLCALGPCWNDALQIEIAAVASAAEVTDESPYHRSCRDGSLKAKISVSTWPSLGLEPVGEPAGRDIEESVAVGQDRENTSYWLQMRTVSDDVAGFTHHSSAFTSQSRRYLPTSILLVKISAGGDEDHVPA